MEYMDNSAISILMSYVKKMGFFRVASCVYDPDTRRDISSDNFAGYLINLMFESEVVEVYKRDGRAINMLEVLPHCRKLRNRYQILPENVDGQLLYSLVFDCEELSPRGSISFACNIGSEKLNFLFQSVYDPEPISGAQYYCTAAAMRAAKNNAKKKSNQVTIILDNDGASALLLYANNIEVLYENALKWTMKSQRYISINRS